MVLALATLSTSGRLSLGHESNYRRAQTSCVRWRVRPIQNKRGPGQYCTHHFSLHANTLAVNDSHVTEPGDLSLPEVFLNHQFHVTRLDSVKIEDIRDGNRHWLRKRIEGIEGF